MKNGKYTGEQLNEPPIKYAWFKDDKYHREDEPAIEYDNGDKFWYINGKKHRLDGPAIECDNGYKVWLLNGEPHREDGPAVEFEDGDKIWFYHGERIDCQSQEEFERIIKLLVFK